MSRSPDGPVLALRVVAQEARAHRERAGMTAADAARRLGVHTVTVRRLERAHTLPRADLLGRLMEVYGADPRQTAELLEQLERAREPGWWKGYGDLVPRRLEGLLSLESEAALSRVYAPALVPEPLRTPGYARDLLALRHPAADEAELDRRLELLLARQRHRGGRLWVLLEEAVLDRASAHCEAVDEQRRALARYAAEPGLDGVTLQWIGADAAPHPLLLNGQVDLVRHPHRLVPDHLVLRALDAVTVTDAPERVDAYATAMDVAAQRAHEPGTPLPRLRFL
ncbi:Scr1 family TA system antitoxin-like transcriptional regulator [Streptomyces sp. NPDC046887]|uniref:Scr1 family TA system antitoxin-like transcriptional regulator n=1 Tax=Streptomyces sp. NPDC046887 TaxID=3155472 RepID=UPI0033D78563